MKTNLCPARSLRPSLALLVGLLIAFIPAAHAQDYDDSDLDLEMPELYGLDKSENWNKAPALPVPTAQGQSPTIVDFARAFTKRYPAPTTTALLAKLDGLELPEDLYELSEFELDKPNAYLRAVYTHCSCHIQHMEMCYWIIPSGHRLVGISMNTWGNDLLVFYDYSPKTKRMTPIRQLPFKDFYDNLTELNVKLPRQGLDIQMEPGWYNDQRPLTLKWNGQGGFTLVGAAERYRKPAPSNDVTFYALANISSSRNQEAMLYDAPNGKVSHRLTPEELKKNLFIIARVKGQWAQVKYTQPEETQRADDLARLLKDKQEGQFRSAWLPLSSFTVGIVTTDGPTEYIRYLHAEPTVASRRLCKLSMQNEADYALWAKLLEAREGWLKVQLPNSKTSGWVETRYLYGYPVTIDY